MQEKIYFKDNEGKKICGILSGDTSGTVMLLIHGFSSSKESSTYVNLEEEFNRKRISTFRIDLYGHGESEGDFADITLTRAVDGAVSAINFLKEKGYQKIGLMGSSFGGITGLITAVKSEDLFVLVLRAPVCDLVNLISAKWADKLESWKETGYDYYFSSGQNKNLKLNYSYFEDSQKYKYYEEYDKIKIPTLILHGDKDINVPIEQSIKTSKIIPNCKLEVISGANHFFNTPGEREKCLKIMVDFVMQISTS